MAHVGRTVTAGRMIAAAAVEPDDARYRAACEWFDCQPPRYPSVEQMLDEAEIDALIIASPNHAHLSNLRALRGRNLPVLLEKPLDAAWDRICEVVRFSRHYPAPILVGHCMRYAPIFAYVRQRLVDGAVGQVCSVRFISNCAYGADLFHTWRRQRRYGGGMLIEKATHDLDLLQWFIDARPTTVTASTRQAVFGGERDDELTCDRCPDQHTCPEGPVLTALRTARGYPEGRSGGLCVFARCVDTHDDEMCLINFENGVHAVYVATYYTPESFHHRNIQIIGSLGCIEVALEGETQGGQVHEYARYGSAQERTTRRFECSGRGHYEGDRYLIQHFDEVVSGGAAPRTTVPQAFIAEALGHAAQQSAAEGRTIAVAGFVPEDLRDVYAEAVLQ